MRFYLFLSFLSVLPLTLLSIAISPPPFDPCNPNVTSTCLITQPIALKTALVFSTKKDITIYFTTISALSINLSSVSRIMMTGSRINASNILLYSGNEIIVLDSVISTSGMISWGKGYTSVLLQGFGHAGIGSVCIWWEELIDNSYGPNCAEYAELYRWESVETQGSGGIRPWEFGGGRIVMKSLRNIYFSNSEVKASGLPSGDNIELCEQISDQPYSKGGTGGFILIEAEEINLRLQSTQKTKVEAKGGYYCDLGWGGSGGRINIVANNANKAVETVFVISVNGGKNLTINEEYCSNGATGTLCLIENGMKKLIVNGEYSYTQTPTILSPFQLKFIDDIYILKNALTSFKIYNTTSANIIPYEGKNLHIDNSDFEDFVHSSDKANVNVSFEMVEITSKSKVIFHQSIFNFSVQNFMLSEDSIITFYKSVYLISRDITIKGNISASRTPSTFLIILSQSFLISETANIYDIENIALRSTENFYILGRVSSFKQTCTYNLFSERVFFDFADKNTELNSFDRKFQLWTEARKNPFLSWFQLFYDLLQSNYTIMILSEKNIFLSSEGSIIGARIGVWAQNLTINSHAKISTTAFGCAADSGPGKGQSILHEDKYCGGMGGSYGGYKGYGLGALKDDSQKESKLCQSYARQIDSKEQNLPYGGLDDPNYEGSGGGSGDDSSKDKSMNRGGSGGGIIIIGVFINLTNDGLIESNGESTNLSCMNTSGPGAGSGGSIQIKLRFLAGSGKITSNGGDSGFYCGEGGGGRIKVYFIEWSNESLKTNLTQYWNGNISVEAGIRWGSDSNYDLDIKDFKGSFGTISVSPCLRGYHPAPLCIPCSSKYYKDSIGDGECKPCINKPMNSEYEERNFEWANCTYICHDNMNNHTNPSCQNAFTIYVNHLLDIYGGICFFFLILLLLLGYLYRRYKKPKKNTVYDKIFNLEKATEKISIPSIISEELKRDEAFTLTDLLYHVHRICVYGTNRYDNRWYINPEPQQEIEYLVSSEKYKRFVEIFNKQAKWNRFLAVILRFFAMVYYPFYWAALQYFRRKVYNRLLALVQMGEITFLKILDPDDLTQIKIKMSVSDDYTLCFIDIFNYKSSSLKYFTLSCPFTIMFAGEGNFFKPFNLNLDDPFLKCLYFSVNQNKETQINEREKINEFLVSGNARDENNSQLHIFIKRFNKIASTIDFAALDFMFYSSMESLVEFVRLWNIKFFQRLGFRVEILVMQIAKERFLNQQNSITLLENKEQSKFKKFIKDIHILKTLYSSYDVRFAIFVFDIHQDVKKLDLEKISLIDNEEEKISWSGGVHPQKSHCSEEDLFSMKEDLKRKNYDQNLKYPMIDLRQKNFVEASIKRNDMKILKFIRRYLALLRFAFMSHKRARFGKRITSFFVFAIMIVDIFVFMIICINLTLDYKEDKILFAAAYPGAIILGPVLGCLWISSTSYNIGKLFLMFNYMALMNCILNLFLSIPDEKNGFVQYSLKSCSIIFKILLSYFGSSWLPHIKKYEY